MSLGELELVAASHPLITVAVAILISDEYSSNRG